MAKTQPTQRATADARHVTLDNIIENVGAGFLEVIRAPRGLAATVGELVIHDPGDRRSIEAGDVVLAVGIGVGDREATALVDSVGAGSATAVIFRLEPGSAPESLLEASAATGVALLGVAPDIVWGQLHALLRTAVAVAGAPGDLGPGGAAMGDLFSLANAVSSMVGGATTIEDTRSTVLAYSSTNHPIDDARRRTILGRRVPDDWLQRLTDDGVFQRLWAGGVVRIDYTKTDPGYGPRLAVAICAGGEVLGSIWVLEGERPLGAEAEVALAEAGGIAALHLLRHRASGDLERRRRGDLLRSVFGGRTPADVLASSLGIAAGSYVTVVAFELAVDPGASVADQSVLVDRADGLIMIHCEAYRRQAATLAEGRVVYVVLPERTAPETDRLATFAAAVVEHLSQGVQVGAKAGIGRTVHGLDGVLDSRADADQALRALSIEPSRTVAHIDSIRSRAVLLALRDLAARDPGLRAGKLDFLVEHDRARQGSYVETLHAYLDSFGDVAAAAASLNVHANTFRYRLRRLLELSGINLNDATERLITHLQLTFMKHPAEEEPAL